MKKPIRYILKYTILFLVLSFLTLGILLVFFPEVRILYVKKIPKIIDSAKDMDDFYPPINNKYIEIIFNKNIPYAKRVETLKSINAMSCEYYCAKSWGGNGTYKILNESNQEQYDIIEKMLKDDPNVRFTMPIRMDDPVTTTIQI